MEKAEIDGNDYAGGIYCSDCSAFSDVVVRVDRCSKK